MILVSAIIAGVMTTFMMIAYYVGFKDGHTKGASDNMKALRKYAAQRAERDCGSGCGCD